MIIYVDVKTELDVTCVMDGRNNHIIRCITEQINVKIKTVEKVHVQIFTHRNRKGS